MNLDQYIAVAEETLKASPIISSIEIVDQRVFLNRGYFPARLTLSNADYLEIAESFAVENNLLITLDYRYQWMDQSKQTLRKRWDSVKHFPGLPNFPHHVHVGSETNVESGQLRSIVEFIRFMETEVT